jgi:hypothetical protein
MWEQKEKDPNFWRNGLGHLFIHVCMYVCMYVCIISVECRGSKPYLKYLNIQIFVSVAEIKCIGEK